MTETSQPAVDNQIALSIRNVSKMYPLYANPRDRLRQSLWYALPKFLRGSRPPEFYREFWALRSVLFEVKKGETVGIIGRNGSGKSTLLQIIAGTLTPSWGEVQVNGRVAALLELGSGFNPEFTGRENVYLNGSILGLTQVEIDELYGDIVSFADIGQFIDQPVKLYSSGMVVRLAFAVQAFVPKEVFIVDEALSVGDEAFQRKCMASLERFQEQGGTVLLVSHNAQTIVRQCQRCLLLSQGELLIDGPSKPTTDLYQRILYSPPEDAAKIIAELRRQGSAYLSQQPQAEAEGEVGTISVAKPNEEVEAKPAEPEEDSAALDWFDPNLPQPDETSYGNGGAEIIDYGVYNAKGDPVNVVRMGRRYKWTYLVKFYRDAHDVQFGMLLRTVDGIDVAPIASKRELVDIPFIPASSVVEASFSIKLNVAPGTYFLNAGVDGNSTGNGLTYLHRRVDICMIRVLPQDSREIRGIAYLEPEFTYRFNEQIPSKI